MFVDEQLPSLSYPLRRVPMALTLHEYAPRIKLTCLFKPDNEGSKSLSAKRHRIPRRPAIDGLGLEEAEAKSRIVNIIQAQKNPWTLRESNA